MTESQKSGCWQVLWGILELTLVVLRVNEVITWSWWLVLLPMYVGFIIAIVLIFIKGLVD